MNLITITAIANGNLNPGSATHPNTVTNGDFTISGNSIATAVGEGVDESTTWGFDFTSDPNFNFFTMSQSLVSAKLTLELCPKNTLITTDRVSIKGMSAIQQGITTLPLNVVSQIDIELLNHYSAGQILNQLINSTPGIIPMVYGDDAIISRAKLVLTQRIPTYQYAVKIVCGKGDGRILAKGIYHTAVNIHNPTYHRVRFRKKFAVALPGKPGLVTKFYESRLGSDQALEIDCPEIMKYTKSRTFVKGFVIIESDVELDIVAVYTAAGVNREENTVDSIHTERVAPRVRRGRVKPNPSLLGSEDLVAVLPTTDE